jgi:tRNA(Ile)-lysidine synthetase-like protein
MSLLRTGTSGARVPLGSDWTAELAFGRLRIFRAEVEGQHEPLSVQGLQGQGTWGRWQFYWRRDVAPERQDRAGYSAWFTLDPLTVRSWMPGEKLKPLGGTGRRLVVRCFQEERVPRSRRSFWPVLAQSADIMWVPGVCRSDAGVPEPGSEALRVDAQYS